MAATEQSFKQWIGGHAVDGAKGTYPIVNPATEQVVGLAPEGSADDAKAAAAAAAEAFKTWSLTTPEYRSNLLSRAADLLEKATPELIPLVQAETGSTIGMARTAQVPAAVMRMRRYARVSALLSSICPTVLSRSLRLKGLGNKAMPSARNSCRVMAFSA